MKRRTVDTVAKLLLRVLSPWDQGNHSVVHDTLLCNNLELQR